MHNIGILGQLAGELRTAKEYASWMYSFANRASNGEVNIKEDVGNVVRNTLQMYMTIERCAKMINGENVCPSVYQAISYSPTVQLKPTHPNVPSILQQEVHASDSPLIGSCLSQSLSPTSPQSPPLPIPSSPSPSSSSSSSSIEKISVHSNAALPKRKYAHLTSTPEKQGTSTSAPHKPAEKRKRRARAPAPFCDDLFCHSCGETQTSEWRRGPDGYKSLCNACGLHYASIVKKEKMIPVTDKKLTLDMILNSESTDRKEQWVLPLKHTHRPHRKNFVGVVQNAWFTHV